MTDARETLLDFYREHAEAIDLDDFNLMLRRLGQPEIETLQTVEIVVRFKVDVSDLQALTKDALDVEGASIEVSRTDYSYNTGYSLGYEIESIEVTG